MLTQQQIDDITSLCQAMGVKYYDVQLELVDHIAGMIDNLQEKNLGLNFEDALQLAIKEFTPSEFKLIVKNKERQLLKRFKRLWFKEFLAYFTFPKIMVTVLLVVLMVFIDRIKILENFQLLIGIYPALSVIIITRIYNSYLRRQHITIMHKKVKLPLLSLKVLAIRYIQRMIAETFICLYFFETTNKMIGYQFILYQIPLLVLFFLAWTKVYVDQNVLMRQQYAVAFKN